MSIHLEQIIGDSGSNAPLAFAGPNVAGNLLICVFRGQNTGPTTVSDTNLNNWLRATGHVNGGGGIEIWYAANCKVGANTVTALFALGLVIAEYSGLLTASVLDQVQSAIGSSAGYSVAAVSSLANPDELLIGGVSNESANFLTDTSSGSFTDEANDNGNVFFADRIVASATGPYTYGGTLSSSVSWAAAIATFKAPASTHSISGNAGVAGATVAWTGTASGSTTADGSGNYTIPSLADGPYTITPSKTGYTFAPISQNETVAGADITGVNFTATQIVVATPTFSPGASTYNSTQHVTVSDTDSALTGFAMYYTTDGSTPTTGSTLYTGPITISTSETLKVLAVATGYANSAIASGDYTIRNVTRGSRSK